MWRQSPALQFRPLAQHAFLIDQTQRRIEQLQQQADQLFNEQKAIKLRIQEEDSKERRNDVLITELKQEIARLDRKEERVGQELLELIQVADRAAERTAAHNIGLFISMICIFFFLRVISECFGNNSFCSIFNFSLILLQIIRCW